MKASDNNLQNFFNTRNQYVVPLFQRTYTWDSIQWKILWDDIDELLTTNKREHFMGPIVIKKDDIMETDISKCLIVDGQQRILTFSIIISVIRDILKNNNDNESKNKAKRLEDLYLFNSYTQSTDKFKIMPTQEDRRDFFEIVRGEMKTDASIQTRVVRSYRFFYKRISSKLYLNRLNEIENIILHRLKIVNINLENDDNPYQIFESLNHKGVALTQADLIRNQFFMFINNEDEQNNIYNDIWLPMQKLFNDIDRKLNKNTIGNSLSLFLRHFLMKDGGAPVDKHNTFIHLQKIITEKRESSNIKNYMENIYTYSKYYYTFLDCYTEINERLRDKLKSLKNLNITTFYPLLLNLYNMYKNKKIDTSTICSVCSIIENFLIRRYICKRPSNKLLQIFQKIARELTEKNVINNINCNNEVMKTIKNILLDKQYYPDNKEFIEKILIFDLYKSNSTSICRIVLDSLENYFLKINNHSKEATDLTKLTIEHIMPKKLTNNWKISLGTDFQTIHTTYLNTIGNLTLTGYNSELGNSTFEDKKKIYKESKVELNKYFEKIEHWNANQITERSKYLAKYMVKIWSYIGNETDETGSNISNNNPTNTNPITGSLKNRKPRAFYLNGKQFEVNHWSDVLKKTFIELYKIDDEKFEKLRKNLKGITTDSKKYKNHYDLYNGYYVKKISGADNIYNFCYKITSSFNVNWSVDLSD